MHSDLTRGQDVFPVEQSKVYLVLGEADLKKGYIRPYRESYTHLACGKETRMNPAIAGTYATDPWFYSGAYCVHCRMYRNHEEFVWGDGTSLDPGLWRPEVVEEVQKAKLTRAEQRAAAGKPSKDLKYWKTVDPATLPNVWPIEVQLIRDGHKVRFTFEGGITLEQPMPTKPV
jgi:hypothetical protein